MVEIALRDIQEHLKTPFESLTALQQHAVMCHLDRVSVHNLQALEDGKKGLFGKLTAKLGGLFRQNPAQPRFTSEQMFNVAAANLFPQHDVIAKDAQAFRNGYQLAGEPHSPEHKGSVLLQDLQKNQVNFSTQEGHQILQMQKEIKGVLQYFENEQHFLHAQAVLNKKGQNLVLNDQEQAMATYLERQPVRLAFEKIKRQKEDAEANKRFEAAHAARLRGREETEKEQLVAQQQREALKPQAEHARHQELERLAVPDANNPLAIKLDNLVNCLLRGEDQSLKAFTREEIHLLFNAVNPLIGGEKPLLPASLKARIELLSPSDVTKIREKLLSMIAQPR